MRKYLRKAIAFLPITQILAGESGRSFSSSPIHARNRSNFVGTFALRIILNRCPECLVASRKRESKAHDATRACAFPAAWPNFFQRLSEMSREWFNARNGHRRFYCCCYVIGNEISTRVDVHRENVACQRTISSRLFFFFFFFLPFSRCNSIRFRDKAEFRCMFWYFVTFVLVFRDGVLF